MKGKDKILIKWLADYKDLFVDDYRTSEIDRLAGNSLFLHITSESHEETTIKAYSEFFVVVLWQVVKKLSVKKSGYPPFLFFEFLR